MSSNVLVTGASAGFGRLTVLALLRRGHRAAAAMRDPEGRNRAVAEELRAAGAIVVDIDVTDDASVDRGVRSALAALGHLDAVVNNAGVGVLGLQESFTPEDFRRLFDINVFGVQRVNRAVLPHFRTRRSGLLVHVSSLLGRITLPFYGPYNASKWAVEALAENYRAELSAFGIESVVVEPGGYATTFIDRLMKPSDSSRDRSYGELAAAPEKALHGFEQFLKANPAQDPRSVADAVAAIVEMPAGKRPFRTVVDNIGMGQGVEAYNARADELTRSVYRSMGIGAMIGEAS
jgi:NAD(P)-dependent dehydrogenase (short-subunit alcohol dehydrogenase family)